ncbi:MAG: NADH-quinone oxidoreductase subunit J [Firmicutes bacterium]|nr:NADH-quinone oxidoreductase subunit J [Bacillota bacterium]
MGIHLALIVLLLVIPAIFAVFSANMLRAAIALLICSVGLTLVLFNLGAPLAGVFELSVCAGLITVLFILAISLIKPLAGFKKASRRNLHYQKFYYLPILAVIIGAVLWFTKEKWITIFPGSKAQVAATAGQVLWETRGLDLIGQVVILLVGVFGVVVLFKRGKSNG